MRAGRNKSAPGHGLVLNVILGITGSDAGCGFEVEIKAVFPDINGLFVV